MASEAVGSGQAAQADAGVAAPGAHLGPRQLTTLHAIGQALAIGPIFSVGLVSGLVANVAGFSTPLSVVLGAIGSLGLAYVIAIYARRYAGAGAIFEYLSQAVHNSFGIFSAGVYLLGTMFLGAGGIFIALGFLIQGFFASHLSTSIPWWTGGAACLLVAFLLNHYGVRIAIRGVLLLASVSAIPFLILAVVIIAKGGVGGNTLSVFGTGSGGTNAMFNGILFAVTLFIGFEAAASIAEETENPRRSIPIAVVGAVAISAALYILVTYAATIGFGKAALAKGAWFSAASPMGTLATTYVGNWLSVLIDLVIILDALSLSIAIMVTASRIIFALGRDGLLPKLAARTSRHDTPVAGNVFVAGWSVLLLIWAGVTHYGVAVKLPNPIEAFNITSAAGSYLVELIYVFLAVFALKLLWTSRHDERGLWWKVVAVLVGLATPILAFKGALDPFPAFPNNRAVFIAIACVVIPAAWYGILHFTRPEQVRLAARHAVEHQGVPPLDEPIPEPAPNALPG
ncbi:MAG TPA: APC family permease [Solirubrobacteraceae bacterium]|nr:APC family permease [Solirubrobacteraceae bacterium]